ncbi:retrotransposon protein, putative, ty1-copia subclass [Tanacetum coccineum]|uniref:Retrotransposon protein, putative, ty1-copia subclass n=1 Tax=Tanacetum coccineum TaxID=301880 RepID=A0ABQ5BTG5_9ASTR
MREFHWCKHEEGQSVSSYVLKMKGYIDNLECLGHSIMRKTVNELDAMLKLHEQTLLKKDASPALHAIRADSPNAMKGSRKLKPRALNLYVGNGYRAAVEAIRNFHLCLPSGLVVVLNNCHFAPFITRGIILVSRLYDDGFVNHFENNAISVSKNNLVYFHAIPRDDINEIDLHDSNTNDSSIHEFLDHLKEHGIIAHHTPPYTPQHNGVSERRNRALLDMVRSMISQTTLPKSFWDYALESAACIYNMVLTKKGCEALVKRDTLTKPDKLEPRSIKCIFVGYPKETMGYSFYYLPENKVLVAWNAEFFKNNLITQEASGSLEDLKIIQEKIRILLKVLAYIMIRMIKKLINLKVISFLFVVGDLNEPANYKAAILYPESDKWLAAMNAKMQSMKDNQVWDLVDLHPNAKGFTQTYGVDYEEIFSHVADIRAIRILIAIATYYGYEIWQMDVKTSFLNGHLSEEVYMVQPESFVNPKYPNQVCKLKRSIYGLKQASRQWDKRFDDEIKKFGFTLNRDEPCVYMKASGSNVTFLILYVDDILIMGNHIPMLQDVKSYLGKCFAIKDLGEAAYVLGIKIYRDRSRWLIGLCQSAYIEKILKRFNMKNSKRKSILMQDKKKLCISQDASTPVEVKRMQRVSYASADPRELHWTAVKNILKYLRNTKDMFLVYRGDIKRELRVSCYTNVVNLTDVDDTKSQTGYEAVWIRKFIYGLGIVPTNEEPMKMYCDNTRAITIANKPGITKGAIHYRAKVHYLRETKNVSENGNSSTVANGPVEDAKETVNSSNVVEEDKNKLSGYSFQTLFLNNLFSNTYTWLRTEAPSELPKVSMVKTSFQKLKNHLANFDKVVKVRTTPDVITEGLWGFKHTKAVLMKEVIPFIKPLRGLFNDFDNGLNLELNEVKIIFNQMEADLEQCSVMNIVMHDDSVHVNVLPANNKCLMNDNLESERLIQENDHLFKLLLSQDIVHICVNSLSTLTNYAKMKHDYIDEYSENLVLKVELAKKEQTAKKKIFGEVVLRCSRLENPKLDAKDVSIANLKNHIESLIGKNVIEKDITLNKAKVIALGIFKLDLEPLSPKGLVKHARAIRPLDGDLDFAYIKHSMLNANSKLICATCYGCMFDAIHDSFVLDFVNDVNVRSKSKYSKSSKKKTTWKPTGKVFTTVGYKWIPTSRKFSIEGNRFPLTRITSTNVVPPKNLLPTKVAKKATPRRNNPKMIKDVTNKSSSSRCNGVESNISNNSEPSKTWGSNVSTAPSFSLIYFRLSKLFSGIWTPDAPTI